MVPFKLFINILELFKYIHHKCGFMWMQKLVLKNCDLISSMKIVAGKLMICMVYTVQNKSFSIANYSSYLQFYQQVCSAQNVIKHILYFKIIDETQLKLAILYKIMVSFRYIFAQSQNPKSTNMIAEPIYLRRAQFMPYKIYRIHKIVNVFIVGHDFSRKWYFIILMREPMTILATLCSELSICIKHIYSIVKCIFEYTQ